MDSYTIGALCLGAFAFIVGVSRLVLRAVRIAKYGPDAGEFNTPSQPFYSSRRTKA